MPRRNFLQILQDAKIDIKREYQRLFDLFYTQSAPDYNGRYQTLRQVCENNFLIVPFRGTCLSLNDFDDFYNYNLEENHGDLIWIIFSLFANIPITS